MSLLDFLKKKKTAEKAKQRKPEKKKAVEKVKEAKEEKPAEEKKVFLNKRTAGFDYEAVRDPHISEKSTDLAEKSQYIFKVSARHNKKEIKNTIEGLYGVDVLSVNVIKIPRKKKRLGRIEGYRKGFKKAVVKIKEGQKIEIL
ncbi:MAG: 50S ribosomal protein L23 [Candidatus Staskawiczbacteria bacterium]|nr:50S ribosomal protein L23 [Candidatus Staskawiczbacteria bacterium]